MTLSSSGTLAGAYRGTHAKPRDITCTCLGSEGVQQSLHGVAWLPTAT